METDAITDEKTPPYVDDIFKERHKLKQKQIDIQNNIKITIDNTDNQIRKLKNKIQCLENKKKTLIIEYNKECNTEDRIRGTTPPQTKVNSHSHSGNKILPLPSKTGLLNIQTDEVESNKFRNLIETLMENKLKTIENRIDNRIETNNISNDRDRRHRSSSICDIM